MNVLNYFFFAFLFVVAIFDLVHNMAASILISNSILKVMPMIPQ